MYFSKLLQNYFLMHINNDHFSNIKLKSETLWNNLIINYTLSFIFGSNRNYYFCKVRFFLSVHYCIYELEHIIIYFAGHVELQCW